MADFGAPVAQNVNVSPNQGIQTISGLLNLKQQHLAIEQSAAETYQAQQSAAERQKLASIPWKSFQNADGSFDVDKISKAALAVAPTTGQEFVGRFEKMAEGAADTKKAYHALNQTYQDGIRAVFGAWAGDPHAETVDLQKQLELLEENAPESSRAAIRQIADHSLRAVTGPDLLTGSAPTSDKQKQTALAFSRAGLAGSEVSGPGGLATPIAGTAVGPTGQVGGTAQSRMTTEINPTGGGVPLGLTPAQLAEAVTLPNGQVTTKGALLKLLGQGQGGGQAPSQAPRTPQSTQTKGPTSPFLGPNGHPRTAQQDAPPANAPAQVQQQFAASVKGTNDYVDQVRSTDEQYGTNMAVNTAIRNLLKGGVKTGPGTQQWHNVLGALGAPADLNNVSDYQQLGAWLDRQAAGMRGTLGLPATNAGQAASETISGSTNYQPEAISAKNNFNQALVEGLHQQRQGLDRVAGYSGNPSPSAVGAYRAAWANNFDPLVHEYKAAKKRGDTDQVKAIISTLTPEQAAALAKKGKNLDRLEKAQGPL